MKRQKLFRYRKIISTTILAAGGIWLSIRYAAECTRGIRNGIGFCVEVLVPSLFFFMAVAAYLVKSGVIRAVCAPLRGIFRRMFGLPPQAAAAILPAIIGGYPVGARCVAMLYQEGDLSESQAAKTAYIAVAAGPGFIVNYVGAALLNSKEAGALLLAAQIIAVVLTGVIAGSAVPCDAADHSAKRRIKGGDLLVASVGDAARATFAMCAMVVIFSAIIEIADAVIRDGTVSDLAAAVLEVTTGCNRMCGQYPLTVIAFFIGFGGLSVHFQIYAFLQEIPVRKGLFFLFRIIEGIISMLAAYILLMIFPIKLSVFRSTDAALSLSKSATLAGSAALAISSLCFIGSISQTTSRR